MVEVKVGFDVVENGYRSWEAPGYCTKPYGPQIDGQSRFKY